MWNISYFEIPNINAGWRRGLLGNRDGRTTVDQCIKKNPSPKSIKNPNSAILQPLHCIDLAYYYKESRNIQILKEASISDNFININKHYEKMMCALTIIEIVNKILIH